MPEPSTFAYQLKLVAAVPGSKSPIVGLVSEQNACGFAGVGSAGALKTPSWANSNWPLQPVLLTNTIKYSDPPNEIISVELARLIKSISL